MKKILQDLEGFLPVEVDEVLWDGDTLIMSSAAWCFRSGSVWRVSGEEGMLCGCWDDEAFEYASSLSGLSVVEVGWLVSDLPIDPYFKLSDGRVLSVFCSVSCEPWFMEFSSGNIYMGNS